MSSRRQKGWKAPALTANRASKSAVSCDTERLRRGAPAAPYRRSCADNPPPDDLHEFRGHQSIPRPPLPCQTGQPSDPLPTQRRERGVQQACSTLPTGPSGATAASARSAHVSEGDPAGPAPSPRKPTAYFRAGNRAQAVAEQRRCSSTASGPCRRHVSANSADSAGRSAGSATCGKGFEREFHHQLMGQVCHNDGGWRMADRLMTDDE